MPIRDILLHLNDDDQAESRTEAALALARDHEAHLTALFVAHTPNIPTYIYAYIGDGVLEEQKRRAAAAAAEAKSAFVERMDKHGISCEWRDTNSDDLAVMAFQARYSDLCVVSQGKESAEHASGNYDLAEELVLTAGRPILIIPYAGSWPRIGGRVLVAWNGGREASRAVSDAMPILEKADKVTVFAIDPESSGRLSGADLCTHLARHGVEAEAKHTVAADIDGGDVLLSEAFDSSADLIVMGGYGHSRLRELALGGVTRHILNHMTAPVLMSH